MGLAFFIQSEALRLLMGSLSPFTFRVTIERYEFSVIMIPLQPVFVDYFFGLPLSFTGSPLIFLESCFGGHVFFQFLLILEALYLSFYSE